MSRWTSEYAIFRDLSVAQGRVPVRIERTVGAGDKPPSLNINEETEEEFFDQCSADVDVNTAPDLVVIQQMLDMVRDLNVTPHEEDFSDKGVVISKLNANASEFTPDHKNTSTPIDQSPKKEKIEKPPKKRQRNIAVESILQSIADKQSNQDVVLRKPTDFVITNKAPDLIDSKALQIQKDIIVANGDLTEPPTVTEKVNGWFETQTGSSFPKKTSKVVLDASNIMFKKRNVPKEKEKTLQKSTVSLSSNSSEYKPSTLADEYYLKYKERNKFKETVKDSIWTKAEKRMKEIDEKRRQEAVQVQTSPSTASQSSELVVQSFEETQNTDSYTARIQAETKITRCLNIVALPQHRHMLTGECIVCEVMKKKPQAPIKSVAVADCEEYMNEIVIDADQNVTVKTNVKLTESDENEDLITFEDLTECVEKTLSNVDFKKEAESLEPVSINVTEDGEKGSVSEHVTNYDKGIDVIYEDCEEYMENIVLTNVQSDKTADIIDLEFTEDVQNVYECDSKAKVPFYETCLSDQSF